MKKILIVIILFCYYSAVGKCQVNDTIMKLSKEAMNCGMIGDYYGAIEKLKTIFKIAPNPYSLNIISGYYGTLEEYKKQIFWGEISQELYSDFWEGYYNSANAYTALGDYELAKKNANKAKALDPENPLPFYCLGIISEMEDDKEQAKYYYKKSVELNDKFEDGYYNLATIHVILGELKEAKNNYLKVLELNPNAEDAKLILEKIEAKLKENK